MEKKVVLEVNGLSKFFGGIKAVNNIDLKLYEKEIIAIVGDNGAGKSTLIKTISGVHIRTAGKIYVGGEEADINNPIEARNYGIETVYQDQGLISVIDAASNLFLGREKLQDNITGRFFKNIDDLYMKKETMKMLESLGIELEDINAKVQALSGGQRQTIVVGRAVYWGGKIIIFDEPTNNLGVKQERRVLNLIKKIRDEYHVSIIVISHNIAHVFELVDRIIVLRNGEVIGEKIKEETDTNEIVSMITGVTK